MSENKEFDAAEWLRKANEEQSHGTPKTNTTIHFASTEPTVDEVETVIRRIEASHTDITAGYENWRNLGFAFTEEFGEAGRGYFHRISRFYPDYKYDEAEKQYTSCKKSRGSGITIRTFFHIAQNAGVDITHKKQQASPTPTKVIARKSTHLEGDFSGARSEADANDLRTTDDSTREDDQSPNTDAGQSAVRATNNNANHEEIQSFNSDSVQSDRRSAIPEPGLFDAPFYNIDGMFSGNQSGTINTIQFTDTWVSADTSRPEVLASGVAGQALGVQPENAGASHSGGKTYRSSAGSPAGEPSPLDGKRPGGQSSGKSPRSVAGSPATEPSALDGKRPGGQSAKSVTDLSGSQSGHAAETVADAADTAEAEEEIVKVVPMFNTPRLPDSVHHRVPGLLRECCDMFAEDVEKDVVLVSALTVISACLPNIEGVYFDEFYTPHLFTFIAAPAGSGKGKAKWARYLGSAIHFSMVEQSKVEKADYERELDHYLTIPKAQREGLKHPVPPKRRMFFIPANSSASGFIQTLADNNFQGMIFETEADTLGTALKQEWGNFCDVLRKAFHHESTAMFRRKDSEHTEVIDPHLAILLAGTPKQIHNIMPNVENGLFSRFLYYAFEDHSDFRNPFLSYRDVNYVEFFTNKGKLVMEFYNTLLSRRDPIRFRFTERQGELFTERFNTLYQRNRLLMENDFNASSRRMGLITFRIAMVLSALRMLEDGHIPAQIECSDIDFEVACQITFILEQHAIAVFRTLPDNQKKIVKLSYYLELPLGFTRQDYLKVAGERDITAKTAQRYIREFTEIGWLKHEHNWYSKVEFDPLKLWKK